MGSRFLSAWLVVLVAGGGTVAMLTPRAAAQTNVYGLITDYTTPFGYADYNVTFPGPVGRRVNYDLVGSEQSVHAQADSAGGPGFVASHTYTQFINSVSTSGGYGISAESYANAQFNDIVVTGPGGGPATVPIALNLRVDGAVLVGSGASNPSGQISVAQSQVVFNCVINGMLAAQGSLNVNTRSNTPGISVNGGGIFANFGAGGGIFQGTSDTVMVPVNTPFSIRFYLDTTANVYLPSAVSGNIAANTDFAHTASFATTGPAVMLPAGYTINSAQAGITNNVFTMPSPRCQPADIADDQGTPIALSPPGIPNSGVNEGDYNCFFNSFFTQQAPGSPADISDDSGAPLPPFGPGGVNNGVNEGDYNCFFNNFFNGCPA